MITIFLDADGSHELGSYVLVLHPAGIRYETQCNGTATEFRGAEGFLVSVGPSSAFRAVIAYFAAGAANRPSERPVAEWSDDDRAELQQRVEAVQMWITESENDEPRHLTLDATRLGDSYEAWLAVTTPYGPGWLLGQNSD